MTRAPGIWLREQTGWYCTKIRGVVHKLAKTEPEAKKAFYKLMARDTPAPARKSERHTVRWLADKFLDRTRDRKEPDTWVVQRTHLQSFCDAFGGRPADSLRAHEVNDWLDSKPSWGQSTKALVVTIVKAVFNWAVSEDYLTESPVKKVKRRKVARRERVLSEEERKKVLSATRGEFRDYLSVLLATGMRPFSEAAGLTAEMIDWAEGRVVLAEHKNRKRGKSRVVYFADEALAILKRLAGKYPEWPLFRNRDGRPWRRDSVDHRLGRLCEDNGIDDFNTYSLRSTFVSRALVNGVPVEVVAELVGTSPKMIWNHYAAINTMSPALAAAARKAVG